MHYYEVLISAYQYRGTGTLTYGSVSPLSSGMVVLVPMKGNEFPAIILKEVSKPSFTVKPMSRLLFSIPLPETSMKLVEWLATYYPAPISSIASLVLPSSYLSKQTITSPSDVIDVSDKIQRKLPELTEEQQYVISTIYKTAKTSFLLHGDTGTGKTRVYIELINRELKRSRSAIVLTPEISLTPQLEKNIAEAVSAPVLTIHSNLTSKERRELWTRILYSKSPLVVIGARSALFAPIKDLGIVIVDEFHDTAYKQDQSPYYTTTRVAGALAHIHNAKLILGSATPPVTEYYYAKAKDMPILRMSKLATPNKTKTNVEVIDARNRSNFSRNPFLSDKLILAISKSIQSEEQSLVFLNRRGTARLVSCQDCDWQAHCPHCDLPLTYHGDSHTMRCHTCGFVASSVVTCPSCGSAEISYKSIGTKALESQLQKIFPDARIKRFDTDNLKDDKFAAQYQNILDGEVDIIVGTQMLVKGLDLPKLSVVGVAAADSSLYFPDYTAEEQTYQLLSQVMGRVSRGHRNGTILIQTNDPTGAALLAAIEKKWEIFYEKQIQERRQYLFPPFCFILKLTVSRKSQKSAINAAEKIQEHLQSLPIHAQIIGPAPRFNEKIGGNYNWQLIIKSKNRADLLSVIRSLPANCSYDIDPANLL